MRGESEQSKHLLNCTSFESVSISTGGSSNQFSPPLLFNTQCRDLVDLHISKRNSALLGRVLQCSEFFFWMAGHQIGVDPTQQ